MATDPVMPPVHPGEILLEEFLIPTCRPATTWKPKETGLGAALDDIRPLRAAS